MFIKFALLMHSVKDRRLAKILGKISPKSNKINSITPELIDEATSPKMGSKRSLLKIAASDESKIFTKSLPKSDCLIVILR